MSIKYKTLLLTIPANGEIKGTILSVPSGNKATLTGLANNRQSVGIIFIEINENRMMKADSTISTEDGAFLPLNTEIAGPQQVIVGMESAEGSSGPILITLQYKE